MNAEDKQVEEYESRWPIDSTGFEALHGKTHKYRVLCLGAFEDEIRNSSSNIESAEKSDNTTKVKR